MPIYRVEMSKETGLKTVSYVTAPNEWHAHEKLCEHFGPVAFDRMFVTYTIVDSVPPGEVLR